MSKLSGGDFLNQVFQKDVRLGTLLQRMITGINNVGQAAGVDAIGETSPPAPPDAINVTSAGEMAHIQITHNSAINRGIQYFTEVSTNPQFLQPLVIDHGASRTSHPITLPTKDSTGATHSYYFRSYAQYHGSPASPYTVFGGAASPTAVTMSGSTQMNLLPSTGSGTASATGSQGGQGLGKYSTRPAVGPKRQLGS